MSKNIEKEGKFSTEELTHFQCGDCKRWWSIGDILQAKKIWFCPWCGLKQSFKKAKNG